MTPKEFVEKWKEVDLKERTAAQSHFIDLCHLLGVPDPVTADPKGEWFTFEKGATKTSGGEGWADVWRKNCFAWEYKGKNKDLEKAFSQLQQYAIALENPPLLVVSDIDRIRVHTNWTNTVQRVHEFQLDDLIDAANRERLKSAFLDPEKLRPAKTRQVLTEEAAQQFVSLTQRLRQRGHKAAEVAHFVNRLVFCMFAEDVGLLTGSIFERMLSHCGDHPEDFQAMAQTLFGAMKGGGRVGFEKVEWFNGGLFDSDHALPLEKQDIADLQAAAKLDWSDIDPSILGTLFERGLDPDKRSQLGAHYTDRDKIMQIVNPVIVEPLLAEWTEVKGKIEHLMSKAPAQTKDKLLRGAELAARTKAENEAEALHRAFLDRMSKFRVLDPACGSGNFLYLALKSLKDIEHRVNLEAEALGLHKEFPRVGPECVLGIEINSYAAELARVSVWVGEIQWMRRNGFDAARNPILRPLQTIECRDAVLDADGKQAAWPKADVVIGNPPFLGTKRMRAELGDEIVNQMYSTYHGVVRPEADLVCYWFAKAWDAIRSGNLIRAGLVATNSIRGGANRDVLSAITKEGRIFSAWNDEEWTVEGAAVRVSIVCFDRNKGGEVYLNGEKVNQIFPDLTAQNSDGRGVDLTLARAIKDNKGVAFMGDTKGGEFDIAGATARLWLTLPVNPNGRTNADVLRPWVNGMDLTRRPADKWIIDFGWKMDASDAAIYEEPYKHVFHNVKPERDTNRRDAYRLNWWRHLEPRQGMCAALARISRFIGTPRVAKFRVFTWLTPIILPDSAIIAIARDDDTAFGILHSRFHEVWSLRMGTFLGVGNDPRYTPSTTFETFPFPDGLTPNIPAPDYATDPRAQKIAAAAAKLNELRENWLNPSDLVRREPEVVPGYPERILPVDAAAEKVLAKRTLTNLYNSRPAWLDNAHKALDEAVAEAYGWGDDWRAGKLTDDEILARLFKLNQERAAQTLL